MKKTQLTVMLSDDATRRLENIAERLGMSRTNLISIIMEEMSYVRPEGIFEAVASVPAHLKTRPVGRPAGSRSARKIEKKPGDQAA